MGCDCGIAQKTVSICIVGDCKLLVSNVEFSRKRRNFKLINNPFPAKLHPGSCLGVVIQYRADSEPEACELVIHSDDPHSPVKVLDVVASTKCVKKCTCKQTPCCCDDPCDERRRDDCWTPTAPAGPVTLVLPGRSEKAKNPPPVPGGGGVKWDRP